MLLCKAIFVNEKVRKSLAETNEQSKRNLPSALTLKISTKFEERYAGMRSLAICVYCQ